MTRERTILRIANILIVCFWLLLLLFSVLSNFHPPDAHLSVWQQAIARIPFFILVCGALLGHALYVRFRRAGLFITTAYGATFIVMTANMWWSFEIAWVDVFLYIPIMGLYACVIIYGWFRKNHLFVEPAEYDDEYTPEMR